MAIGVFNLGNTLSQAEGVKSQRLQNSMLSMDANKAREAETNRQRFQEIRKMTDNIGEAIHEAEAEGNFEVADKLRELGRSSYQAEMATIQGMMDVIEAAEDKSGAYKEMRSQAIQMGAVEGKNIPVDYDSSFFKRKLKEAQGKLSALEVISSVNDDGSVNRRQLLQNDLGVVSQSPEYQSAADRKALAEAGSAGGGMKTADASFFINNARKSFGANIINPVTGELSALDPETDALAVSLATEAERLFKDEGYSQNQAFAEAQRRLGINVRDIQNSLATDPLSLNQ